MSQLESPCPGEVVGAWMPETEEVCSPGSKFRPVLVMAVDEHDGQIDVLCAYGTSQNVDRVGRGEFVVTPADLRLEKTTKFCLRKMYWLPLEASYFARNGAQAVAGRLSSKLLSKLAFAAKEVGLK